LKQFLQKSWHRIRRHWHGPCTEHYSEINLLQRRFTAGANTGRVMVDVGAQFGESFVPFRQQGWRILAFEPDPDPRKQEALQALAGAEVMVVRRALAEHPCEAADFYASDVSTGISTLVPFHDSHRAVGKVEVSTLALELAKANLNRVDFIKIDTEGHDLFVLKGFPWGRLGLRPHAVLCEYEDAKTRPLGYTWRDLADFLMVQGYAVLVSEWKPIVRYGVRHNWIGLQRYPGARVNPDGWGNLIALSTPEDVDWVVGEASKYSPA
jgi:FkbM family methyltransferase